jgi:hypothetical protein
VKEKENIRIELFDPPMCCPSGLCGPVVDPALLDVHEALIKLKNDRGIGVERYLLHQQGRKFMENPEVLALLKEHGTGVLPLTAVNGRVVKMREFPRYEELLQWASSSNGAS